MYPVRRGYHPLAMTPPPGSPPDDQLSLELEPGLPALPATLRPMLARLASAPFDSPDHLFEPAWGGRRAVAFLEAAVAESDGGGFLTATGAPSVRLLDPGLRDLAPRLRELADLPLRVDARSAVLDGELVVVDAAGRANDPGLEERLAGRPGPAVAYLVFDLLYLDGRPLLRLPLHRRRGLLRKVLAPGASLVAVPAIAGEGRALNDAATAQGLSGVMARRRDSPYLPGIRSRLWRFVAAGAPPPTAPVGDERASVDEGGAPVLALIARLPLPFADDAD